MKMIINTTFRYMAVAMMLVSCAKSNPKPNPTNNNNASPFTPAMTVLLNGLTWTAKADSGQLLGSNMANIYGVNGIATIYLSLNSLNPATYALSPGGQTSVNYTPDGIGLFKSDSGSVVITSDTNNIIQGTFQARLTNGSNTGYIYKLANGKFIAKLQY